MNKVKTLFRKNVISNIYKEYGIQVSLTETDLAYMTASDSTGMKLSLNLDSLHKFYPMILDSRDEKASEVVRLMVRLQYIIGSSSEIHTLLHNMFDTVQQREAYRFMHTLCAQEDFELRKSLNILDITDVIFHNTEHICDMLTNKSDEYKDLRLQLLDYMSTVIREGRKQSLGFHHIPAELYTAEISLVQACSDIVRYIPWDNRWLNSDEYMQAARSDPNIIVARKEILKSLYDSKLYTVENVNSVLYGRTSVKPSEHRSSSLIDSGNTAYIALICLNKLDLLSSGVFFTLVRALKAIRNGNVLSIEDIVGDSVSALHVKMIVEDVHCSNIRNLCDDWMKEVSLGKY